MSRSNANFVRTCPKLIVCKQKQSIRPVMNQEMTFAIETGVSELF